MGYGVPEEREVVGELKEGSNLHMVFVSELNLNLLMKP